ncbi:MAG: UDP-N-acetylmuramate dehydrogenase [Planctomycetes bacterium]|nr:UDP-N-acetylmuramate dehydrogenase [Planctomycetota bacterium]
MPSSDLRTALAGMRGAVRENVPLAPYMHLRIGGPADWLIEPYAEEDVALAVRTCRELDVPIHILGGGSNVVVADAGVRGAVLHLGSLNRMVRDDTLVTAGAGCTLASLLRATKEAGLAGLERLTGIPAMVGGAVAMNAGTRDGETFDLLASMTVVEADGTIAVRGPDRFAPVYRDGRLQGAIVVQASFRLEPDDPNAIFARFSASLKKRNATQPVSQRSVGCVFRNPDGDAAGRLIERSGCKTLRLGDIEVSGTHANYFVNSGGGTAADFVALMAEVQRRVRDAHGVELQPEVKFWGF